MDISQLEFNKSISFEPKTVRNHDNMWMYFWDAKFENETLGFKQSLADVKFCFDWDNSHVVQGEGNRIYSQKCLAKRHLLLKIIMDLKPNIVNKWLGFGDMRFRVIHSNKCGLTQKRLYQKRRKTEHHVPVPGWFVVFTSGKGIYAIDSSKVEFSNVGGARIDYVKKHSYKLG